MSTLTAAAGIVRRIAPRFGERRVVAGVEAGERWIRVARPPGSHEDARWNFTKLHIPRESLEDTRPGMKSLRESARSAGIAGGPAVCAVHAPVVDIFPLHLRPTGAESLESLVVSQGAKQFGEPIGEAVLDFSVLPDFVKRPGEESTQVLVFAARKKGIDRLIRRLERIGMSVDRLLTPACVIAPRVKDAGPEARHLIVVASEEATSVSVAQDGHVLLERILPWGSERLAGRLREELDLSESQSVKLLEESRAGRTRALPAAPEGADEPMEDALRHVLEPEFEELVREISGCLGYCDSFFRHAATNSLILTGSLADGDLLRRFLGERLGLPVRDASDGLELSEAAAAASASSFSTAAACALWGREGER